MGDKTPPSTPDNSVSSQSDVEAVQNAVNKAFAAKGPLPEEIPDAPPDLVPFKDAAVAGDTVINGLPGEAAGPLSASTLADGAATGVPAAEIGYVDAAGTFFSGLIGGMSAGALILAGVVVVGIAAAIAAAVYYGYHGGLNSKQATAAVDQVRNPNSDETLQSLREANQNSSPTQASGAPKASAHTAPAPPRQMSSTTPPNNLLVAGTWLGTYSCGLKAVVLELSTNGARLNAKLTGFGYPVDNPNGPTAPGYYGITCEEVDPSDFNRSNDYAQQLPVASAAFDGSTVTLQIPTRLWDFPGPFRMRLRFLGDRMVWDYRQEPKNAIVFRRAR